MTDPNETRPFRISTDALVVLAGPSGSGKSTWAAAAFRAGQIVSADDLRGVVGEHTRDLRASDDAFAVLDDIVTRRLRRGLLTVVDTLGMDPARHERWQAVAAEHGRPTHLVVFDTDPRTCRSRNRSRADAVPSKVLTAQLERWVDLREQIGAGYGEVHEPGPVLVTPRPLLAGADANRAALSFGLQVSAFDWPGDNQAIAERLAAIAVAAERIGFQSLWLMDHFVQIPQVGRAWEPMLESYTTLGYLAGRTSTIDLGAMVTCITHRNVAHLAKIVATLDVLSGGRARCGLGLGWFEHEHRLYGYEFPSVADRYELLEDALELLPVMWGPGSPAFEGRRISLPETVCYPRPLRDRVPVLVGGSGERRTLRLVARHADACNLFGEPDVVAHKVDVLRAHCIEIDRDPDEIEVTQLSTILCAPDRAAVEARVTALSGNESPEDALTRLTAGTPDAHADRFQRLAEAGVDTVIVSLADVGLDGAVENFAPVIAEFGG